MSALGDLSPKRSATAWTIKQISIQESTGNTISHPPTSLKHQCCTIHAVQHKCVQHICLQELVLYQGKASLRAPRLVVHEA